MVSLFMIAILGVVVIKLILATRLLCYYCYDI